MGLHKRESEYINIISAMFFFSHFTVYFILMYEAEEFFVCMNTKNSGITNPICIINVIIDSLNFAKRLYTIKS